VIYNVAQLLKAGVGAERRYAITGALGAIDELNESERPVGGQVRLVCTPKGVLATGVAKVRLRMICRRCLVEFEDDVAFEFEEEYIATIDMYTGATLPVAEDEDPDLVLGEQHQLNLAAVLQQYAIMATTSEAVCSAVCCGLCPECGQNLNQGTCQCDRSRRDPRMSALGALLPGEPEA
jgi:uncharacterized protein